MRIKLIFLLGFLFFSSSVFSNSISVNEAQLEFEVKGNGKHVVLFEAGAISGMKGWDSIWNKLPADITAIRYSRRGEGNSSSCEGNLTSINYVNDLVELLKVLKIEKPLTLVSHSYGSKVARYFASTYPDKVSSMLFIDPINPRDVNIIEAVDPEGGKASNEALKLSDIKMGKENGWCLIKDIWDKKPSLGYGDIKDIPITLIAGIRTYSEPKRLFDTDEARELWGKYQSEWVLQFPQGKAVMAHKSGHFVHDDEPQLVLAELKKLLLKAEF